MTLEVLQPSIIHPDIIQGIIPSPEYFYQKDKVIKDLKGGFLITFANSGSFDGYVAVVTKIIDDLFIAEISSASLISPDSSDSYFRLGLTVGRKKQLAEPFSYERWEMHMSSWRSVADNFRVEKPEEILTANEFWQRYNVSVVDERVTREYSKMQERKLLNVKDLSFKIRWL